MGFCGLFYWWAGCFAPTTSLDTWELLTDRWLCAMMLSLPKFAWLQGHFLFNWNRTMAEGWARGAACSWLKCSKLSFTCLQTESRDCLSFWLSYFYCQAEEGYSGNLPRQKFDLSENLTVGWKCLNLACICHAEHNNYSGHVVPKQPFPWTTGELSSTADSPTQDFPARVCKMWMRLFSGR